MSDEALATLGANSSLIHVDWMIGSAEMDVDGIAAGGASEPLMRAGRVGLDRPNLLRDQDRSLAVAKIMRTQCGSR